MDTFYTIRFKKKTAKRFREFSKIISKTHTETMEVMLDFFEKNRLSPYEDLGPNFANLENLIKKKINGLIAIVKNIEKEQTKPTYYMIKLLFQEVSKQKKPLLVEKKFMNENTIIEDSKELKLIHLREQILELKRENRQIKYDFKKVLNQATYMKITFGKSYYKLDMTRGEFEDAKLKT